MSHAQANVLLIEVRSVYGRENLYPANEPAKLFASIAGTKTISRDVLRIATALGFQVAATSPEFRL